MNQNPPMVAAFCFSRCLCSVRPLSFFVLATLKWASQMGARRTASASPACSIYNIIRTYVLAYLRTCVRIYTRTFVHVCIHRTYAYVIHVYVKRNAGKSEIVPAEKYRCRHLHVTFIIKRPVDDPLFLVAAICTRLVWTFFRRSFVYKPIIFRP